MLNFSNNSPTGVKPHMAEKILVVDDDENTLWLVSTLLQHNGFQALTAASPHEGLRMAQEQKPDMVLLDVMMPEMDGWEVCRRLRAAGPLPVLFLTARDAEADRVHGLELGGDDYVVKPFSPREVVARVQAILRRGEGRDRPASVLVVSPTLELDLDSREV